MNDRTAHATASAAQEGPSAIVWLAVLASSTTSGAAIMMYELLAIRILQRDFGGTVDVWAAEIAVCLAGLAIGYALGGWLADRYGSPRLLGLALVAGGLTGLLIHPLARFAGRALLEVDFAIAWHPLVAAGFSTFLPVLALGTVLPQAIRIAAARAPGIGTAAGWIAAISTCGSIAGVLLTSMVLLHRFGVIQILNGASAVLAVVGLCVLFTPRRVIAASAVVLAAVIAPHAEAQVRFETYSAYHHILVRDEGGVRSLTFDDAVQSMMSLENPDAGGFEYTDFFHVPKLLNPTMKRVLFVGLGGGTGPKAYLRAYPDVDVDVVEIDPQVYAFAQQYFALPENPRLKVHIADGRAFLNRAPAGYGAILLDAYGSGPNGPYLPYHMATQEFFRLVWDKLENGGCLFFNAIGKYGGMQDEIIRNLQVTIESVFQASYVFEARGSINTLYVAQKIDASKLRPDGTRDGKGWPDGPWLAHPLSAAQLRWLAENDGGAVVRAAPGLPGRLGQFSRAHSVRRRGQVLTDNFAPVDVSPGRRR